MAGQRQSVRAAPLPDLLEEALVESLRDRLPVGGPNRAGVGIRVVQQGGQLRDQIEPASLPEDRLEAESPREGRRGHRARLIIEDGGDLFAEETAVAFGVGLVGQLDEPAGRLRPEVVDHGIAAVVQRAGIAAQALKEHEDAMRPIRHGARDGLTIGTRSVPRARAGWSRRRVR